METKQDATPTEAKKDYRASNDSAHNGTVCLAASYPVVGLPFNMGLIAVVLPLSDGKMGMTLDRAMRIRQVRAYVAARKN